MTQNSDPKRSDYLISAAEAMVPDTVLVRDVGKGTTHMRGKTVTYLPKHESEGADDYNRRLGMAVLSVNAVENTVTGLAGMVFRKDPTLGNDVPEKIVGHLENVDYSGAHLDTFSRSLFEDGIETGHAGILVDVATVQAVAGRKTTKKEEASLGVRPYWVPIQKEQIIGWRTVNEGGQTLLSQLRIHEPTMIPDEKYGERLVERTRIYKREGGVVTVEVEQADPGDAPTNFSGPDIVTNQVEIPFAAFYSRRTGYLQSRPPLVDVAHTNVAHYQTLADHRYCLHISNVLTPVISGVDADSEIVFGPNAGIKIPAPDGKAYYLEPEGNAFETNIKQLQEFKADMATGGLSMLQRERRAAETATANKQDSNVEQSALAAAARSLQDCLESALGFHAKFMRVESGGGSIAVNREFEDQSLTSADIAQYSDLVLRGQWSLDTLWAKLQEGGVNPTDFDTEVERERIEAGAGDELEAMRTGEPEPEEE